MLSAPQSRSERRLFTSAVLVSMEAPLPRKAESAKSSPGLVCARLQCSPPGMVCELRQVVQLALSFLAGEGAFLGVQGSEPLERSPDSSAAEDNDSEAWSEDKGISPEHRLLSPSSLPTRKFQHQEAAGCHENFVGPRGGRPEPSPCR